MFKYIYMIKNVMSNEYMLMLSSVVMIMSEGQTHDKLTPEHDEIAMLYMLMSCISLWNSTVLYSIMIGWLDCLRHRWTDGTWDRWDIVLLRPALPWLRRSPSRTPSAWGTARAQIFAFEQLQTLGTLFQDVLYRPDRPLLQAHVIVVHYFATEAISPPGTLKVW